MAHKWMCTSAVMAALLACLVVPRAAWSDDDDGSADERGKFEVGSALIRIELTGSAGERRPMDVLLLYPADKAAYKNAPPTIYASRLNGVPLEDPSDSSRWVPMSATVPAERARDGVPFARGGRVFPLIVYSHPNGSDPQNQAPALERLASQGYVVAAPWHEGDTRDDQIIDFINGPRSQGGAGTKILPCFDGGPSPCSDAANFQKVLQNRALDVAALLDEIPRLQIGDRIDMERVALLGQSRGSLTALAAAAGSTSLGIPAERRVKAIMLLAIGARNFVTSMNLGEITAPSLFITSKGDRNAGPRVQMSVSVEAFDAIPDSSSKALVIFERAEHAAYSSNRCAQMQATGSVLQAAGRNVQGELRAIGERLLFESIMLAGNSGTPIDFCGFDFFISPVDIRELVKATTGFEVTETSVPRQLDSATAMRVIVELANSFFRSTLVKHDDVDVHFRKYVAPKYLLRKEGGVISYAETQTSKARTVACDDPDLRSRDPSCPE